MIEKENADGGDINADEVSSKLASLKEKLEAAKEEQIPAPSLSKPETVNHGVEGAEPAPPAPKHNQETSSMSTAQTFQEMSASAQIAAFNAMAIKAKRKGIEVTPVKKFKSKSVAVQRLNKLEAKLKSTGVASPAKVGKKKAANGKAKTPKAAKVAKPKFGHDKVIVSVAENKRFKGSEAFKRFETMSTWVSKNRGKTVAQLIEDTAKLSHKYRRQDFDWDLKRKFIEVKKV